MSHPLPKRLPARPDLEHLKKQAKQALAERRRSDPAAKLADAQRDLAREYGFRSWADFKAEVLAAASAVEASAVVPGPFPGEWIADLARCGTGTDRLRSARLHFEIVGDTVTIRHIAVRADGAQDHGAHTLRVDGQPRPASGLGGYELTARWDGAYALETRAVQRGVTVGRGRYEITPDGRTLTVSSVEADSFGAGWSAGDDTMVVFTRAQAVANQGNATAASKRHP